MNVVLCGNVMSPTVGVSCMRRTRRGSGRVEGACCVEVSDFRIFPFFVFLSFFLGVSGEACSLAGHLGLSRLIVLYDENEITIDGKIDLSFSENVQQRFKSYNWHVDVVQDGNHDVKSLVEVRWVDLSAGSLSFLRFLLLVLLPLPGGSACPSSNRQQKLSLLLQ